MLQNLQQSIQWGIEEGMKAGAAHIAEALAMSPPDTVTAEQRIQFADLLNGVTLAELMAAIGILVVNNTYIQERQLMIGKRGTHGIAVQLDAWATLRRALNLPV